MNWVHLLAFFAPTQNIESHDMNRRKLSNIQKNVKSRKSHPSKDVSLLLLTRQLGEPVKRVSGPVERTHAHRLEDGVD